MAVVVIRGVRLLAEPSGRATSPARSELPCPEAAERLVAEADFRPHNLVIEVGAGSGAVTLALARRGINVVGSVPFGRTTDILRRLLDDPSVPLERADVIVQWEVACERATVPPSTLLSTVWAPWWEFRLGRRIPAAEFRPVPRNDAGVLVVTRRARPLLPPAMASAFADFIRAHWPFHHSNAP